MSQRYGTFETEVWRGGHPVWCVIRVGTQEIRFSHRDLRDLKHAVEMMMRDARNELPEGYKDEV